MKKEHKCEQCNNWYLWEYTNYTKKRICPKCRLENWGKKKTKELIK